MKELYALIGQPLGHSFSATYFNDKFAREGIDACYQLWPLKSISELPGMITVHPNLKGFNVTIPYKREVMEYLNEVSDDAREAGAVNCVKVEQQSDAIRLRGFNTDIIGFSTALCEFINVAELPDLKVLVLGSGGAASAVCIALKRLGTEFLIVSRNKQTAAKSIDSNRVIEYSELTPQLIDEHRLIINTTPLGMTPEINVAPPFPWQYLSEKHYFFDLIYNPSKTLAMRIAEAHGAKVCNGLKMLYSQADAAWKIWQDESSAI